MKRLWRTLWLRIASAMASKYGCRIVHAGMYDKAAETTAALYDYTFHSGHLTRGFKAGKVMQAGLCSLGATLGAAGQVAP